MKNVLVTGAHGFIGKNLVESLRRQDQVHVITIGRDSNRHDIVDALSRVDLIYHLAGVNRTTNPEDFVTGNREATRELVNILLHLQRKPQIIYASSIQATIDNPYGRSKKAAEEILTAFSQETGTEVAIYRLPNVFGKWCKPHYHSVVATFCYNLARGLDITISDPSKKLELVYVDDVVNTFVEWLYQRKASSSMFYNMNETHEITVGELARRIQEFTKIRSSSVLPALSDPLTKYLYSTYLSYLEKNDFAYPLRTHSDHRGYLFEILKSDSFGQIFVSKSEQGVIRGNHYHNTKVEKFCVIKGKAKIQFRHVWEEEAFSYEVSDHKIMVLDIPPGYTHSIENVSEDELIVLFWANEMFDPQNPDTYPEIV